MKTITYTGKEIDINDICIEDICIEDIAHSLSMQCRYNGHINQFYSVAEHSYLVNKLVGLQTKEIDYKLLLTALLHDATEAYIGDIIRPIKIAIPELAHIEQIIWKQIAIKFDLPKIMPEEILESDHVLLEIEKAFFRKTDKEKVSLELIFTVTPSLKNCLSPEQAELKFLEQYHRLTEIINEKKTK